MWREARARLPVEKTKKSVGPSEMRPEDEAGAEKLWARRGWRAL